MIKVFNVNGACTPARHYMVDLEPRLKAIKAMVDDGEYFTINKARQYGKTTTLRALTDFLKNDYLVLSIDFQNIESIEFSNGSSFVHALTREINRKIRRMKDIPDAVKIELLRLADRDDKDVRMAEMFNCFSVWCEQSLKPIVLIIDEVDTATNNQVFLDFLAQLRAAYIDRDETPTFQCVILAGVYDVRNIKRKIRPEEENKQNSPWNIAADFDVDMSFSAMDIAGMLKQYEMDYQTNMNVEEISGLLYDYTSGYPFLVSRLCKLMDEKLIGTKDFKDKKTVWSKAGVLEAVKRLLSEKNPLFDSLIGRLNEYPKLKDMIYLLLFHGQDITYNADD